MKKSALFPILLCFGTLFSCNLCMAQTEASSHTQGIIYGQNIFIQDDVIMIPYENHWVLKPQNGILWQRTFFEWLDKWLK